jgi:hypothetical protein
MMPQDDLDQVIARAMRARSAPSPIHDLAARARARAQHAEDCIAAKKARLGALRRRNQLANVAACILIGILITVAFCNSPVASYSPEAAEVIAANSSLPDMGDIVDSAAAQMDIDLICGAILLVAVLLVAIEQSIAAPLRVAFGRTAGQ